MRIGPDAMARQQKQPAPLPDPFNGTTKEREPCLKAIVRLVWKGLAEASPSQLSGRYVELAPLPAPFNGTTKEREPCPKAIVRQVWKGLAKASPNELAVGTYSWSSQRLENRS